MASYFLSLSAKWLEELILSSKEEQNNKKEELKSEKWECIFLVWGGTRKRPKATEVKAIGEIKGNWFYLADGSKKSIHANGFKKIRQIEE